MKHLETAGFATAGMYTAFDEQYLRFTHKSTQASLIISDVGREQCSVNSSFTEFLGYIATDFDAAPNSVIAASQLQHDRNLDILKWTPTLTRSWVLRCPFNNGLIIKISGDEEENRIQFCFLNHVYKRTKSTNAGISVPAQYALLETAQGFSAVCMEYIEGKLLSSLEIDERNRMYDETLYTLDALLEPKYHPLINDIGHRGNNGHYNNIIISPAGGAVLFDMPNMSSPAERSAVLAVLHR